MSLTISKVQYYYSSVKDEPGEAYKLLSILEKAGVNLLAFTAIPIGVINTQFTLFPEDEEKLIRVAKEKSITIHGPISALYIYGDDKIGALTQIHETLFETGVNVEASTAVTDGKGGFGYIIYLRTEHFNKACLALNI